MKGGPFMKRRARLLGSTMGCPSEPGRLPARFGHMRREGDRWIGEVIVEGPVPYVESYMVGDEGAVRSWLRRAWA